MTFDFPYKVIRTDRKRSASIEVVDDFVKVTVPENLSEQRVEDLIKKRVGLIRQKLKVNSDIIRPKPKEYVNGETFTYLGRNYRLRVEESGVPGVKLVNGYLTVSLDRRTYEGNSDGAIQTALKEWYQAKALIRLKHKTKRYALLMGVEPQLVEVKDYVARWGSCSKTGQLSYNWRIIIAPHQIVDYIVVHELCHLIEHNHGPKFWRNVESVLPDYRTQKAWLKSFGQTLTI